MSKGVIYVMSTVVSGLIKIGQTQTKQYENRMRNLENNGYANITGLKREFAIEVSDYINKEKLIHTIFSKSQLGNTELFALDISTVIKLLSSFEGKKIYPANMEKEEVFKEFTHEVEIRKEFLSIPDGNYYLEKNVKGFGKTKGIMKVERGIFTVLKGSVCATVGNQKISPFRQKAIIKNNILQEDIICKSPSTAALIILARSANGWAEWKNKNNQPLQYFRQSSC